MLESVAGYTTLIASIVNMWVYYKEHAIPSNPDGESSDNRDIAVYGNDGADDGSHEYEDSEDQMSTKKL